MTTGKSGPDCVWVRARQKYSLPRTYHTPALFHISNDRSERWFSALFCCCCCSRRRRLTVLMVLVSETSSLYLERSQCIISFVALFIKSVISNSMTNKVIIKSWAQSFYIDECCALSTVWAPQASNLWERVCLCVNERESKRARQRKKKTERSNLCEWNFNSFIRLLFLLQICCCCSLETNSNSGRAQAWIICLRSDVYLIYIRPDSCLLGYFIHFYCYCCCCLMMMMFFSLLSLRFILSWLSFDEWLLFGVHQVQIMIMWMCVNIHICNDLFIECLVFIALHISFPDRFPLGLGKRNQRWYGVHRIYCTQPSKGCELSWIRFPLCVWQDDRYVALSACIAEVETQTNRHARQFGNNKSK